MSYLFYLVTLLGLIFLSGLVFFVVDFTRMGTVPYKTIQKQPDIRYTNIPTIFVHGYRGNRYSFGHMLQRFERSQVADKVAVVKVFADGRFTWKGQLGGALNPTIQVLFKKGTANVWAQTEWLHNLLAYLYHEGIPRVNLVGHSMGAVTVVAYCARFGNTPKLPQVAKVVTIAGPFNDFELGRDEREIFSYRLTRKGPEHRTPIYQFLKDNIDRIPKPIDFLNIVGNILPSTRVQHDGSVSSDSSFALAFILQGTKHHYAQALMRGPGAAHSLLHENALVDENIVDFLWRNEKAQP
ncbi:alpha/beta fold hydrolase [Agrilactobacillus composti]|uniref:alpha/beta fold hydrolase n=1 Tax=Agrilactobacillus composti TaxID=398555 RepID=UPI001267A2D7|nr:alpha/beta fold hydrolase [Agrilactobacillus composti]